MTRCVTGMNKETLCFFFLGVLPLFASRGFAAQCLGTCALPSQNLIKKRDCSQCM